MTTGTQPGDSPGTSRPTTPLSPEDDNLVTAWGLVLEGTSAVMRALATELRHATCVPPTWVEVLFRLRRTPGELLPTTQLAREVSFSSGGFTKLMDHLVEDGLVERQPCPSDRRVVYAVLTERGREVADRALKMHVEGLRRRVLAVLGREQLESLAASARALRDANVAEEAGTGRPEDVSG